MRFERNDYVFYASGGVCRVDDVCEEPFAGAPKGVLYYVLHTLAEPKQTIWNPVSNDKVYMRHVMTIKEAEDFFTTLPTLPVLEGDSAKTLREAYISSLKSGEPLAWGRVMRTFLNRKHLAEASLTRVTDAERGFYESARRLLGTEIALALEISQNEAESRMESALS